MNLKELLSSIAEAIRGKTGSTESINAQNMPSQIQQLIVPDTSNYYSTSFFKSSADYVYLSSSQTMSSNKVMAVIGILGGSDKSGWGTFSLEIKANNEWVKCTGKNGKYRDLPSVTGTSGFEGVVWFNTGDYKDATISDIRLTPQNSTSGIWYLLRK